MEPDNRAVATLLDDSKSAILNVMHDYWITIGLVAAVAFCAGAEFSARSQTWSKRLRSQPRTGSLLLLAGISFVVLTLLLQLRQGDPHDAWVQASASVAVVLASLGGGLLALAAWRAKHPGKVDAHH